MHRKELSSASNFLKNNTSHFPDKFSIERTSYKIMSVIAINFLPKSAPLNTFFVLVLYRTRFIIFPIIYGDKSITLSGETSLALLYKID